MKILFAGGGTAGHIEPALAVARAWQSAHPQDEIIFLGTAHGLENSLVPAAGFSLRHIPKVAISRNFSPSLFNVPFQLVASIVATRKILKGVDCAIGFGGYVSGPLYIAATLKRVPFLIHEQNARPGWANRLGARLTKYRALSYPVSNREFAGAELTGLPLRADVLAAISIATPDWSKARAQAKAAVTTRYKLNPEQPLIFIFGGSQGSQAINAVIDDARRSLENSGLSILHGVGKNNLVPNQNSSYCALTYIEDMAECYLAADLLIGRSGAVTCAEAQALARYSLFIPLPIGNGEQALNAATLVEAGRAEILDQSKFNSQWLEANLARLLQQSSTRSPEGDASGARAVDKIVKMIERATGK
jgi:UDP-N-acetylglucosamine--N-acetylmuramyl-(pentapeptide) pyrophosphoryl-undecaprenol N-acetylglucosamine transferase